MKIIKEGGEGGSGLGGAWWGFWYAVSRWLQLNSAYISNPPGSPKPCKLVAVEQPFCFYLGLKNTSFVI